MFRLFAVVLGTLTLLSLLFVGILGYDTFMVHPAEDARPVTFEISSGESVRSIAKDLKHNNIIRTAFLYELYVRATGASDALQAGTFELLPGMSFVTITGVLTHAEANEIEVTFPEGLTINQMGEKISQVMPSVTQQDWKTMTGSDSPLKSSVAILAEIPKGFDLEGYLFPDTYRFRAEANAQIVVTQMVETLARRFAEAGVAAPESGKLENGMSVHEVITLASILEKEVRSAEEMKNVADIFLKRMEAGMPLQADSTLSYVLGKTSAELTTVDLKSDSIYNSYTHLGLPPGPISNPGMNAILAVFHPTKNGWYYFLTDEAGVVYYGATYEQHLANKRAHLR